MSISEAANAWRGVMTPGSMGVMTIVEFLEARIVEDEAVAITAANDDPGKGGRWEYGGDGYDVPANGEVYAPDASKQTSTGRIEYWYVTMDSQGLSPSVESEQATHIARHDPARVLREVAAKRAMIETLKYEGCTWCATDEVDKDEGASWTGVYLMRFLAQAYSDHPDFNPEWSA